MQGIETFWRRWTTIRARISLALLIEALLVLPVVALSVFYLNDVAHMIQQMVAEDALGGRLAEEIAEDIRDVQRSERVYLASKDPVALVRAQEGLARIQNTLTKLRELGGDAEGRYARIEKRVQDYSEVIALLVDRTSEPPQPVRRRDLRDKVAMLKAMHSGLASAGAASRDSLLAAFGKMAAEADLVGVLETVAMAWGPEMEQFIQDLTEYGDEINTLAEEVSGQRWNMLLAQKDAAIHLGEQAKRNILTMLMVTLVLSLYFVFVFPRRAVAPIRQIAHIIQQAERGIFSSLVESGDEIGEISRLFNRFITQVRAFDSLKARHILLSHMRLLTLGDMVPEGVIVLKETLRVDYINRRARELLGWKGEQAPGELQEVAGADELARAATRCAAASGEKLGTVVSIGRGRSALLACHLSRLSMPDGTLGGVMIVLAPPADAES